MAARETLLIDESWTKADPKAIKAAGYVGVIGYATHDATGKAITAARVKALHAEGLVVGLVFEDTATRATEGRAAGGADAGFMDQFAKNLGYPDACDRWFACDTDANGSQTHDYMDAVCSNVAGPYGDMLVAKDALAQHPQAPYWETTAWDGSVVSGTADLYQRVSKTVPPIKGVPANGYDENVVLKPLVLWGPKGPTLVKPDGATPAPTHKPHPHHHPKPPTPHPSPEPQHHPFRHHPWLPGWLRRHGWHHRKAAKK